MIKAAAIQIHSVPGQVEQNFAHAVDMMKRARRQGAEFMILPELWSTGYYLDKQTFASLAASTKKTIEKFQKIAVEWQVVLIIPFVESEKGSLFISLAVIEKTGLILKIYRKSFLWGREQKIFTAGKRQYIPVDTSIGRIGVLICYDIEFPEPSRLLALQGAQIIIVPSVWSIPAQSRWDIQLPARALDNTAFVLGVNTVNEGSCGKSKFVSPLGNILCQSPGDAEDVLIFNIDFDKIQETRKMIPYLEEYDRSLTPGGNINVGE